VTGSHDPPIPLVRRYPALGRIPRVQLGEYPTPVESARFPDVPGPLWIKRDDLASAALGGNKVRALEYLLATVRPGDTVLTVGGEGSTHVLATAVHGARLGARVQAIRWRHEMHETAERVARRALRECAAVGTAATPVGAFLRIFARRAARGGTWIPFGGTSPLGILGHINAALELADQIDAGELPLPSRVVVALGTGGTAAGLALGFAAAGLPTQLVGARVGPRIATGRPLVLHLSRSTARWIRRATGVTLPAVKRSSIRVAHEAYGGAYGRVSPMGAEAAAVMERATGLRLDPTYSAKAFAIALRSARAEAGHTLFWSTFDARWMR
jgi:1-aminocyclopropane-1-carboxylate deaminase/D-cysteine desulfhydrase-like pyridoxal-dependent ACC family enzyme